jgi:hypothetical protein
MTKSMKLWQMVIVMKLKVQAQFLNVNDIVGSGEKVIAVINRSLKMPSNKVAVTLKKDGRQRTVQWGRYTEIGVERISSVVDNNGIEHNV